MSKRSSVSTLPKHAVDNRANQLNPEHPAYHSSREASDVPATQDAPQQTSPANGTPKS